VLISPAIISPCNDARFRKSNKNHVDMALPPSSNNNNNNHKQSDCTRLVSTLVALSLYSYIGETLRIVSEQVFGAACHDATKEFPICTTDPGTTSSTGGALFIDLPANMFGCFLIGLFVREMHLLEQQSICHWHVQVAPIFFKSGLPHI
jgi:hypothetical protein